MVPYILFLIAFTVFSIGLIWSMITVFRISLIMGILNFFFFPIPFIICLFINFTRLLGPVILIVGSSVVMLILINFYPTLSEQISEPFMMVSDRIKGYGKN